eukprot:jgi/Bigna1/126025/aug1.1_g733
MTKNHTGVQERRTTKSPGKENKKAFPDSGKLAPAVTDQCKQANWRKSLATFGFPNNLVLALSPKRIDKLQTLKGLHFLQFAGNFLQVWERPATPS